VATASGKGRKKLGQPVPLSNLVDDEKRGSEHPAQVNKPRLCSLFSELENGGSVPASRKMAKRAGPSVRSQSPEDLVT
jgi:hypothetical protein